MTSDEFAAEMSARAPYLNAKQRALLCRIADGMTGTGADELARADRSRRERERQWEEWQLSGLDLSRRQREPA